MLCSPFLCSLYATLSILNCNADYDDFIASMDQNSEERDLDGTS